MKPLRLPLALAAAAAACTDTTAATDGAADVADATLDADASKPAMDAVAELPPYVDPYACPMAAGGAPALDEPLDASEARAGVVRREAELIGGEGAAGRVGHLKIYNGRVRFIVQGRVGASGDARAVGYSLYGGNLIDADRARARGAPGQDVFRETFPAVGFRVSTVEEVAVACDGSNGRPAAIRVVGVDAPSRILGILDNLARPQNLRVVTHYVLRPNSDVLEVVTEAQSLVGNAIPSAAAGDFLGFGSALAIFNPSTGFGSATRATMPLTWLAGVGDPGEGSRRVSYAIAPATGSLAVPVVDASGTVALYDSVSAPQGGVARFTRFVSVGDGDVTTAVEPILRARNEPVGSVVGTTTAEALVYAYDEPYAPGAAVRSMARAAMDGRFRLALPPGRYALVATDRGRARGAPVSVTVVRDQEATASPTTGASGTLVLDLGVLDAMGMRQRGPVKVSLRGVDVEAPDDGMGDLEGESESYGLHRAIFTADGQGRFAVKPGRYRAVVSRGADYDVAMMDVAVPAGGEATLRADVRPALDTAGMVSADFHQHTVGSIDSGRTLCNRVLEDAAEGLEYAATTDHDNVTDFMPCVRQLGLTSWFNAIRGNEISVVGVGHFNAYPLAPSASDPWALIGAQYWADLSTQALFDKVRAEAGGPILHVSHPRSNGLKGYFTSIALDPVTLMSTRQPLATGWEAMEINESFGAPEDFVASNDEALQQRARRDGSSVPVMRDWFTLLSRGERVCALGNSDTHGRNNGSGYPRNYLLVDEDRPDRVTEDMVRRAIRAQRVLVGNGAIVRIRTNGVTRLGQGDVVRTTGGTADLELDVQAAPWVDLRSLALYENGRPVALVSDGRGGFTTSTTAPSGGWAFALGADAPGRSGATRLRATVRVRPAADAYYVAVVRGGSLAPVGAGDAFGYANPTYVDVNGDGWRAPAAP
ncbi:MAG: CehA/McbA family metallohydrolase [Polyangiales bacterium]